MVAPCGGDPLVCIEIVVLGIGEFLKDWTTLGMLALLLVLLLRFRADRAKAREDAYARQLAAYDDRRSQDEQTAAGQTTELFTAASTRPGAEQGRR
jgi:hypothetical protein